MDGEKEPKKTGDMEVSEFRKAAHRVADMVADYLENVESYRVVPDIEPGSIRAQLPQEAPDEPEALEQILADYLRLIEPNITHWQHPGYMAYFSSTASGPGILGEWLAAGLNSNVMFWKNAPASTELEEVVVSWLRQSFGLPNDFDGMFTDTASISTLTSLVAARHVVDDLDVRQIGLAGRHDCGRLRLYCSAEAHSSVEKAAIVLGLGRQNVVRIKTDDQFKLRPDRLEAAIRRDLNNGSIPCAVVATLGTTSSTSIDPISEIADICEKHKIWLHVDAAYGGAAAIVPEKQELFSGWERADSIVINPHKWMFTPLDASLLLFRRPEVFRDALSLVPEYLKTQTGDAHNFHEYGIQLGRRFRALKLWIMLRYFGRDGFVTRIREHCDLAQEFSTWIDESRDWQRLAPVPFSTVCFRHVPAEIAHDEEALSKHNQKILDAVNETGEIFLSHTKLGEKYSIRVTLGNIRGHRSQLERCWELLQKSCTR